MTAAFANLSRYGSDQLTQHIRYLNSTLMDESESSTSTSSTSSDDPPGSCVEHGHLRIVKKKETGLA